jgi:hypothetical protein
MRLFARETKRHGDFAMSMPKSNAGLKKLKEGFEPRNLRDGWARDAYVFADEIGEVGFVMNLQANTGAQCRLQPQAFDLETREWKETNDERVLRVSAAFVGPQGGTAELIRRGFLHLGIAGETLLVGAPVDEVDLSYGLHWEFLSSEELVLQRGGKAVRKFDGNTGEPLGDEVYLSRIYRSHPMFSALADSPMRRVLSICQEILNLTQMVSAIVRSRLSAGILYVPEEITFATDSDPDDPNGEALDEDDLRDMVEVFLKQLAEHLRAPVEDRASAAALVPLLMRGPAEMFDKVGLIEIARGLDTYAQDLRKEALTRLAAGLDVDPAIVQGAASLNHWTMYQVDANFVTKQVRPTGDLLARALTEVYLRTMLEVFEGMQPEETRLYRWIFDPAAIMARTDEAASSRILYDMNVLSDDALLRANGFADADRVDPEELNTRLAIQMLQRDPVNMGPVVADVLGLTNWKWDALPTQGAAGGFGGAPAGPLMPGAPAPNGQAPRKGLPPLGSIPPPTSSPTAPSPTKTFPDQQTGMQEPPNPGFSLLVDRIAAAADMALERALEKAASRFVTKARRVDGLKQRVENVKGVAVLTAVGPSDLVSVDCPPQMLLAEAWDTFGLNVRRWIRSYCQQWGLDSLAADDTAAFASSKLCEMMQELVVSNMHERMPVTGNGTRVHSILISQALHDAGVR